jgi:hypothetical protein
MAVGVSVTLIVIAVIVRRIMQEAELESMVEESQYFGQFGQTHKKFMHLKRTVKMRKYCLLQLHFP